MKIVILYGTRPEAIKMTPVIRELKARPDQFDLTVCVTAQHRELLDQVHSLFQIKPDFDLNIMAPEQSLLDILTAALCRIEAVLAAEKPDMVLVHGDTTTALASALSASYLKIPVGHVEAGLRTYEKAAPFPEEINRRLIATLADIHFAPTETAKQNLIAECVPEKSILVTGNTVVDILNLVLERLGPGGKMKEVNRYLKQTVGLDFLPPSGKSRYGSRMILVTGHRRENHGNAQAGICRALKKIARRHPSANIVFCTHPSRLAHQSVLDTLSGIANIYIIPPQNYDVFISLIQQSDLILTDSGGIQEEASCLNKPVILLREVTERVESVELGIVRVVGLDEEKIAAETDRLLNRLQTGFPPLHCASPYGNGSAAKKIAAFLAGRTTCF